MGDIFIVRPIPFYATEKCFGCGYNLKDDTEKLLDGKQWYEQTGCPKCNKSFVE